MGKGEIKGFGIHLKVRNIEISRKFYESLGFKPVFVYGEKNWLNSFDSKVPSAPEKYRGVTFAIGETAKLELAEGHVGIKNKEVFTETIKNEKVSAMVSVDSLLPLFSNPLITIKFPVRHYYWNTIEAAFRDPDGFVLVFIAPYSEQEFKAVSRFVKIEKIDAT